METSVRRDGVTHDMARALARAAGALARLDQALGRHPLLPAFLHRARLESVRRQAAADGTAIDPWHLAAVIEGLRLKLDGPRIIDNGATAAAARAALSLHKWLTRPDFDQEGEVQRAQRALATAAPDAVPLLAAAHGLHAWLAAGEPRAPIRAALVRHWTRAKLLRAPVPLTGALALGAEVPWRADLWVAAFLDALAGEAEDGLFLLSEMERAWLSARAAVAGRRVTSRAPAAVDLMAATPLISATTLARVLKMSAKSAIAMLDGFVAAGVAVEVTHRAARRLFALTALGEEIRNAVRPPDRPEPGRGPGRPPLSAQTEEAPAVPPPPLPPLSPVSHALSPIDYSALEAAMAEADQVIRDARRRLRAIADPETAPEIKTSAPCTRDSASA